MGLLEYMKSKKIAVFGSGIGALTAVYELLKSGGNYDVTVYQMGWRAGGKGASGRNMDPKYGYRVEEHGLHMWSGLYDNAFRVMREVYPMLNRPLGTPLATVDDAFKPHGSIAMWEKFQGKWKSWEMQAPSNTEIPGVKDPSLFLPIRAYVGEVLQFLFKQQNKCSSLLVQVLTILLTPVASFLVYGSLGIYFISRIFFLWPLLCFLILSVTKILMSIIWFLVKFKVESDSIRRVWLLANFAYGNFHGALASDVMKKGMQYLDDQNYRDWLGKYLVKDMYKGEFLSMESPLMQFIYDAQFSYLDGDADKPNMGAGSALLTILRMALTWKGAVLWRMQGGMGDVVFTPLYLALKEKGVKFEFFHKVEEIKLSDDGKTVSHVRLRKQVELINPERDYDPLVWVKGLQCWPSEPNWNQIKDPDRYTAQDLESYCWDGGSDIEIKASSDFDEIVFGLPVACIPYVSPDMVKKHKKWEELCNNLMTVRTQALQMWCDVPKSSLGFSGAGQSLNVTYHASLLNTISDMTFLIEHESWPATKDKYPMSLYYLCGPMVDPKPPTPGPDGPIQTCDHMNQNEANKAAKETARDLLVNLASPLFPKGTKPPMEEGAPFNMDLLTDESSSDEGMARFDKQYFRANVSPTERFTLTNTGSTRYRIKPDETGISNLKIAGDWTDNSFNLANIEATVMSGMLCSEAICGLPKKKDILAYGFGNGGYRKY